MTERSREIAADVAALLRARNPLLWVVSREEARVEGYLIEAAAAAGYVTRTWDVAQGVCDAAGRGLREIGSPDPVETIKDIGERARGGSDRCVWIMRDLPGWLQPPVGLTTVRQLRNLARMLPGIARDAAQAVVVLSPSAEVPPELANHATVLEWPLPDREEIAGILDATLGSLPDEMKEGAAPNGTRDAAVDAAVGLSGEEAQACYARSLVQLRRIDPAAVAREKKRVIARERVLEWFDPLPGGLDAVGGLDVLKAWLVSRKAAYSPAARAYGLPAPKGALLVGVPGCLHGDTPIYDPVAHDTKTVAQRHKDGTPFNVWALADDRRPVVATAMPPKQYHRTGMYRFTFDNGAQITVTEQHRFLTETGELCAFVAYEQQRVSEPCQLPTISAFDLEAQTASALHSSRIAQDLLDRCLRDCVPDDALPLWVAGIDPAYPPSQGDAPERNPRCSRTGDLAYGSTHSRPYQSFGRLSMPDYPPPSSAPSRSDLPVSARPSPSMLQTPYPETFRAERQSGLGSTQTDTAEPLPADAHSSTSPSRGYTRVRSVEQVSPAVFYDFHVPGYENYWACGLWHHNCGKSLTAKAIATAWGVPLLRLDLNALKSKFVGESEGNLRRALRVVEAIGRCVVWIDEIEKALAGATQGAADGGVSSDALGAVLSWMQERSGQAFIIATANDISSLPPELMRKGRFDEIWFVDLPTAGERAEIVKASLRQYGREPADDLWGYDVAAATEGFTGAEIAAIVPDALFAAFADDARPLTVQDLLNATKTVVPLAKTASGKIDALRNWAQGRARPATTPEAATTSRRVTGRSLDL